MRRSGGAGSDDSQSSAAPPAGGETAYVGDASALAALGERLRAALANDPRMGIDTEFIRERTYKPVLEIVQVATNDGFIGIVDVPALGGELGPLGDLLLDPSVLKILHSGAQDMEILGARLGALPAPVYDTQVAAAFAGFSMQTGYGALVQSLLGVQLSKEEGFADWSHRPLSPSMLAYAENDVRYLHALHDGLSARLARLGRTEWAQEQTGRILGGMLDEVAPEDLWRRVNGRSGLDGRQLAVVRELAIWRDTEAQRRDKPRRSVVKDEVFVEVARRLPQTAAAVLALRGVHQGVGEKYAEAMADCVRRGLAVPQEARPRVESAPPLDDQGAALVELLSAVVRARALEEKLPPSLLAGSDDLRALAAHRRRPDFGGPLFTGWRSQLVGDALRDVLTGRVAVGWDPAPGRLTLKRAADPKKDADATA